MEYELEIDGAPRSVPGGSSLLLLHPSTAETDRIDTNFLRTDTDAFLVISTRTTAHEVKQKLEHYGVDEGKATIVDTLSIERGYSRRSTHNVHYVSAPDDFDGIVARTAAFLENTRGKRRISVDSITEMAYYADGDGDEDRVRQAVTKLLDLVREHDAVGLFHLTPEVHNSATVAAYRELFDGVVEVGDDGGVTVEI